MSRLRLGLLSTARINRDILAAARATGRIDVVAVASRAAAQAEAYANEHAIPRHHGSYEALLGDPEVDAVYVPLPNSLHHEWTVRALEAGKHVLCEKPYSRRPADVALAFDTAAGGGLVLMEAFMYRHHPQTGIVAELVRSGAVGRPWLVRASFAFVLGSLDDVRARPELDGGSLMDIGCYCVSSCRLLGGEPESVVGEQVLGPTGVDMSFRGVLRFDDGLVGQFECSFERPRQQELVVVGDESSLLVEAPWRTDWDGDVLLQREGRTSRVDVPEANAFECELVNFADAVEGTAPPLLGRDDALGQARAIDALYRSADEGRALDL